MKMAHKANYVLLLVAAVWGASYPIARMAVQDLSPAAFVASRFGLAALVLAPWVWRKWQDATAARIGGILGLIEGAVCAILAVNISHMPASRCAFIMGCSVVMVPFWAAAFRLQALSIVSLFRTLLSVTGLYFLTGSPLAHMGSHELWILAAAALWALNIVLLKKQTQHQPVAPEVVAFYQSAANCVVPLGMLIISPAPFGTLTAKATFGLLFCAIFATVMNLILQTKYQRYTSASQAALRLSLEPLFASLVAVAFFGDIITSPMVMGAGLMMLASALPELLHGASVWLDFLRPGSLPEDA